MTEFEYVGVLLSIVISLALTHLLVGIATIIKAGVSRWSIPLLGWIGFTAFLCVDYWFSIWHLRTEPVWSMGFVSFLLLLAANLFVWCWLVIPDIDGSQPVDLAAFNGHNRRKYLAVLFVYLCLGMTANQVILGFESLALVLSIGAQLVLVTIAWIFESQRVQLGSLIAIYLINTWYVLKFIPTL